MPRLPPVTTTARPAMDVNMLAFPSCLARLVAGR
jgi:hypothetical protein